MGQENAKPRFKVYLKSPTYVRSQRNSTSPCSLGLKFDKTWGNNSIAKIFGRIGLWEVPHNDFLMCGTPKRLILPNISVMPLFPSEL